MTKKGSSAASSPSAAGAESPAGSGRFVCSMCSKVYRSGAGLRYHKRKRHRAGEGLVEATALHRVKCQEPACTYQMLAISDLRNHLSNHHQKTEYKCTEERRFNSIAEFSEWKSSFEAQTGSKYVKNCGAKGKSDNQTTEYYYCNRTGPFGQGLRRNKAQGSLRCGIHCTSSMKVEIQNDEQITVQYYPAHYGHNQLSAEADGQYSENSLNLSGMNGTGGSSPMVNGNHHSQQQHSHHQSANTSFNNYPSHSGDCSSSSSPGSASTSPSGGSNSNSNHPPAQSMERSSLTTSNHLSKMNNSIANHQIYHVHHQQHQQQHHQHPQHHQQQQQNQQHHHQQQQMSSQNSLQNHLPHCIIISPSFMVEEGLPSHSNQHIAPVLVVQAQSQQLHQQQQQQTQLNGQTSQNSTIVSSNKKEKCVSDIMREAFQLLSYWPLDHHHGLVTTENEQAIPHSHLNMDEHLMF